MESIEEFEIPYYISDEISRYLNKGKPITIWNNIICLMNLARMNDRLTDEQITYLKLKYK